MSGPRAKLILHIGQHKTGSKALQSFLAHHARALEQRGILYPAGGKSSHGIRAYEISHYRMFALLRAEAMAACGDTEAASHFRAEQHAFCAPFDSLQTMFKFLESERLRTGAGTIVLSAEDIFDMHSAHEAGFSMPLVAGAAKILARIAAEFHYDPVVVVYLRRQDHLLAAHYAQYIKGSAVNDIDFESFAGMFAPRLCTRNILDCWAAAFGAAGIRVRPYEPSALPGGIVPDFFGQFLGFAVPAEWAPPPRDPESVNATPHRDHVEFIRILNRRNNRGLPVLPREDVLNAALGEKPESNSGTGASAWMSPGYRRELLAAHTQGNAEIAARFLHQAGQPLFSEPLPGDDGAWREYPGLSADRIAGIERNIQKIAESRQAGERVRKRARWVNVVMGVFASRPQRKGDPD